MKEMRDGKLTWFLTCIILAIFILLPFHALLTTWAGANFGALDLFRIWKELLLLPLAAGTLWLVLADKNQKKWFKSSVTVRLIGFYIGLHLIIGGYALITNRVNTEALAYSLIINLRFLIFFLVCLIVASKSLWLKKHWPKIIILPAGLVILFGLAQQFVLPTNFLSHFGYGPKTIPAFHSVDQNPNYQRIQSTLRGPNPLGAYLVLITSTCLALAFRLKKWRLKLGLFILTGALVLFFTYSRSAWLGAVLSVGLLLYWLVKSQKWRRWGLVTIVSLVVVVGGAVAIGQRNTAVENTLFHTSRLTRSPDSSNEVRVEAWSKGFKSIVKQPLGGGLGTAGPASFRNNHPPRVAENYYLQIAQEMGLIGLGFFLAINLIVAQELWQNRAQLLSTILLASFVGLLVVNLFSHAWADDTLAYLWWGLAGIALSDTIKQNAKIPKT